MSAEVAVTPARSDHCEAIAGLLDELDKFYGAADAEHPEQRMRHIREALFSSPPAACALLAWEGERLIGLASYSFLWPAAGSTRSLYLKELYVAEARRGKGVGTLLMDRLRLAATEHGCSRVEWTADDDNPGAVRFYEALGYPPQPSKIFYRLEGDDLRQGSAHGQRGRIRDPDGLP